MAMYYVENMPEVEVFFNVVIRALRLCLTRTVDSNIQDHTYIIFYIQELLERESVKAQILLSSSEG